MQGSADYRTRIFIECMNWSERISWSNINWVYARVSESWPILLGICKSQANRRLNIHSVYEKISGLTDQILVWCMHGSGGLPTEIFVRCMRIRRIVNRYSFGVCMGQADCDQICIGVCGGQADCHRIFIGCMNRSGGLLTKYSFGVCMGQANCDQIFIWCMQGSGGLPTEYLFSV